LEITKTVQKGHVALLIFTPWNLRHKVEILNLLRAAMHILLNVSVHFSGIRHCAVE